MKRRGRILLILIALVSFAIALSYPLLYKKQETQNNEHMDELAALRRQILVEEEEGLSKEGESSLKESGAPASSAGYAVDTEGGRAPGDSTKKEYVTEKEGGSSQEEPSYKTVGQNAPGKEAADDAGTTPAPSAEEAPDGEIPGGPRADETGEVEAETVIETETETETEYVPQLEDLLLDYVPGMTWRQVTIPELEELDAPTVVSGRTTASIDRSAREKALPYTMLEKVVLDEDKILPELRPAYDINQDMVGWLAIEDTVIDYPVVQSEDSNFYLEHDFYGEENVNGSIILDTKCDAYTPSYNCVISGHHMRNGSMFGNLQSYSSYDYWAAHKFVAFDSLMEHRTYVIIAAFFSADYDEYEEGFRYNRDIVYEIDVQMWLEEINRVKLYDTEIDAQFGDDFITLTTCDRSRRQDGRFVLIGRRLREGEDIS